MTKIETKPQASSVQIRQFEHLLQVIDCNLSVSCAAAKLGIAQSAVSRSIINLERQCGQQLFKRHGKRLVGISNYGKELALNARDICNRLERLRHSISEAKFDSIGGELRIGATHLQTRYVLPPLIDKLIGEHPNLRINLRQGLPGTLVDMLLSHRIDLVVCTEAVANEPALNTVQAYCWNRLLIAKPNHPLLTKPQITYQDLASIKLITYVQGITGRAAFDTAFAKVGLAPDITIAAADSDVIKMFAKRGHGVGVISSIAYDPKLDSGLKVRKLDSLFPQMTTWVAYNRNSQLTTAMARFVELFQKQTKLKKTNS